MNKQLYYKLAKNIAIISGLFCLFVSVIMLSSFIRIKNMDPLNSPELAKMFSQVQEDSDNKQLQDAARELDLLARKAYFAHLTFTSEGTILLLIGMAIFLICLKLMGDFGKDLPKPVSAENARFDPRIFFIAGGILFLGALVLPILFPLNLNEYFNKQKALAKTKSTTAIFASAEEMQRNWPEFRGYHGLGKAINVTPPVAWDGPVQ